MSKTQIPSAFNKYQIIRPYLEQGVSLSRIAKTKDLNLKTLSRWVKKYKISGLKGLERKPRSDKGKRKLITKELEEIIEALILKKPPLSLAAIHRKAVEIAKKGKFQLPTYRVVWDIAHQLDPALVVLAHKGHQIYGQTYELLHRHETKVSNEIWQADHTPLDIALVDENGDIRKPWLTIIIDDFSRAISGYFLSFDAPCSFHTALALRQAIWRKSNVKWIVCGIPSILYTDHGSDFTSRHIEMVCADLKIQLVFSTVGKPRGRGKVERFFLSLNQLLLMNFSNYAPLKTPLPKTKMTLEDFTPLLEAFILEKYHNQSHSTTKVAPLKKWSSANFIPQLPNSLEQLDLLLLTVAKPRKVRRDGIYFQNFRYMTTTLSSYIGTTVIIRYDPRDLAQISVFFKGNFLCHAICQELAGHTISLKDVIKARRKTKNERTRIINHRTTLLEEIVTEKNYQKALRKKKKQRVFSKHSKSSTLKSLKRYEND
ncbi:MAG: Mu transposase C-terminal domain-containing protein [Saprospiraceae bacterium]